MEFRITDLVEVIDERAPKNTAVVFSVSEKYGIVPQSDLFVKPIAITDRTKYKRIQYGDIVYNPYLLWNRAVGACFDQGGGCVSPAYIVLRPRQKGVERFLHYFFRSNLFTSTVNSIASGSVTRRRVAPLPDVLALSFMLPDFAQQKTASEFIALLDNKISLNQIMNNTLEAIRQVLFKVWFVDFEFNDGDGSCRSTVGKMVDSELGKIPYGWKIGCISDLLDDTISGDWGKENTDNIFSVSVHCIRGTDILGITTGEKSKTPVRFIKERNFIRSCLKEHDIVIEISGGSPTQSTGRTALISKEVLNRYSNALICSNFCKVLRPRRNYATYLFCLLSYIYKNDVLFQFENGTTGIKNLDINSLINDFKILIPAKNILLDFDERVLHLYRKVQNNYLESESLSKIRDHIFSELILGKIRVNEFCLKERN